MSRPCAWMPCDRTRQHHEDMKETVMGEFQYIEGWDNNGPHAMYFPTGTIIIACEHELPPVVLPIYEPDTVACPLYGCQQPCIHRGPHDHGPACDIACGHSTNHLKSTRCMNTRGWTIPFDRELPYGCILIRDEHEIST